MYNMSESPFMICLRQTAQFLTIPYYFGGCYV